MTEVSDINEITPRRFIRKILKAGSVILLVACALVLFFWIMFILSPPPRW